MMKKYRIGTGFLLIVWMTALTGFLYPMFVWMAAQTLCSNHANGSFIYRENIPRGSSLIGQKFVSQKYFWSRPSAVNYNPLPSSGSNLGPTSAKLKAQVEERKQIHLEAHGENPPADLLFASGSGLDPHISPEAALYQVERVAKARGLDTEEGREKIKTLIGDHKVRTLWGFLGDDRVNVFLLNLALDQLSTTPAKS